MSIQATVTATNASEAPPLRKGDADVWRAVEAFLRRLETRGYESYDPYDIWSTRYGVFSRALYYRNSALGLPLIAPILSLEILCPGLRALFVRRQRYATADAQLMLAFLNLYQLTSASDALEKAAALGKDLLAQSVPGYSGHCWGYPFDWQNNRGMWKKNMPFITATPYCYEAFVRLFEATGDSQYLDLAASIAQFVHKDLRETPTSPDAAAGSYSPEDNSKVVNASAYRAMVLFDAAVRFANDAYRSAAQRNLNFILQAQRPDGAWLYALDHPADGFIDHFHTCFVLKNLWKLNQSLHSPAVASAIERGYAYYRKNLFGADDLPRSFAITPRTQLARHEMYDFAEAITLGALLRYDLPEAFATAQRLATTVCRQLQLPGGHFVTRVYRGGFKHTFPFLRWPQAQMFYAMTNFLAAESLPRQNARPVSIK